MRDLKPWQIELTNLKRICSDTMSDRNQFQISEHFWAYEMECPCCARLIIRPVLCIAMDELRNEYGKPISPTSWCRCPLYNIDVYDRKRTLLEAQGIKKKLKTNKTSPHIIGKGKDIIDFGGWAVDYPVVYDLTELNEREKWMESLHIIGVGWGQNFTHIDMKPRQGVKFRSWIYNDGRATARTIKEF